MSLILIAPIILCGYFFCHVHGLYKIKIEKKHGQYLYLTYFVWGLILFSTSFATLLVLYHFKNSNVGWLVFIYNHSFVELAISSSKPLAYSSLNPKFITLVLYSTILGLCLGYTLAKIYNRLSRIRYKEFSKYQFRLRALSDNPEMLMLSRAAISAKPLLFTLKTGKIYVGQLTEVPVSTGNSLETSSNLTIYPILSGYRDNNNKKIIITTSYTTRQKIIITTSYTTRQEPEQEQQEQEQQDPPYMTSLNRHEISTISFFDSENFESLQTQSQQ
jgi:hypothetical protein